LEEAMSEGTYHKDHGPIDEVRDRTGLYKLGFERESVMGLMLPFAIVIGIGGLLGILIWQFL
jgi:hypothetical protein